MRKSIQPIKWALAVVLVWPVTVFAQAYPSIQRDVLDASPQVGTGGYNAPVRRQQFNFGNLYITGNVTGGKEFRGYVPYGAATDIRSPLGSTYFRQFERSSVGLRQIETDQTFGYGSAQPYFYPSSTVLPLNADMQGLAIPGGSAPKQPVLRELPGPFRRPQFWQPTELRPPTDILPPSVRPADILIPNILEARRLPKRETPEITKPIHTEDEGEVRTEQPLLDIEPTFEPVPPEQEQEPEEPTQAEAVSRFLQLMDEADQAAEHEIFTIEPRAEFIESAKRMAFEGQKQTHKPTPDETDDLRIKTTEPPEAKATKPLRRTVVGNLAGENNDVFTAVMRSAQKSIAQGRYLDAMERYAQAQRLRPDDSLPLLGQVNALIASGRLRDAANALDGVVRRSAKLLILDFDGQRLLGGRKVLQTRLNQVRRLSTQREDTSLMLLRGYIELLAGHRTEATEAFEKAGIIKWNTPPEPTAPHRP